MNEPPEETGRNQEESGEGAAARAKPTWLWVPGARAGLEGQVGKNAGRQGGRGEREEESLFTLAFHLN